MRHVESIEVLPPDTDPVWVDDLVDGVLRHAQHRQLELHGLHVSAAHGVDAEQQSFAVRVGGELLEALLADS